MDIFKSKESRPDLVEPPVAFQYLRPEVQGKIGVRAAREVAALIAEAEADPLYTGEVKPLPEGVGETHEEDMIIAPFYKRILRSLLRK